MDKYRVTPYVLDIRESKRAGVAVLSEGDSKTVEADKTINACLKNRPFGTQFWHVRKEK